MKFYGVVGFSDSNVEIRPGVYRPEIVEKSYAGDYNHLSHSYKTSDHMNDDLTVNGEISFIGDLYAFQHIQQIKYIVWRGTKWKVINVDDAKHPRLILTIGGEWNDDRGSQA